MKKLFFLLLASILLTSPFAFGFDRASAGGGFDGRGADGMEGGWNRGGGNGGEDNSDGWKSSRSWSHMGITHSSRGISDSTHRLNLSRQHSMAQLPKNGPEGGAFRASLVSPRNMNSAAVRGQMASLAHNSAFTGEITRLNATETHSGYYWHRFNGISYCHYLDPWGAHWYGWYLGGNFFWTQFYWGSWWWYDPFWFHWCYWYDGWWWWQDPYDSVVYVYDNGRYIPDGPYGSASGGIVEYRSNDGTRTVKMIGQDAFLYDTSGSNAFKPVFLERGVVQVWFSKSGEGKAPRIRVELNDGTFEFFDENGKVMESPAEEKSNKNP